MHFVLPSSWFTFFAAFAINLLSYGGGLGYGWSSPALPKLSGHVDPENNPLSTPTTIHEESWIASLLSLGAVISPFMTEVSAEKIGRKYTLLIFALPMILGNFIIIFASEVWHFYTARFLIGLTEGCIFATIPVYASEISEPKNRGTIGAIMLLFISLGHFTSSIIGPSVTIATFSIISLAPCILFLVLFGLLVPESPYYFVLAGKNQEAQRSLKQLRRKDDIEEELNEIIRAVKEFKDSQISNVWVELFMRKYNFIAFVLALTLMVLQQFSGLIYIVDYTQKIFDVARTPFKGNVSVMFVTSVQVISIALSTYIIDKINRKTLLVISLMLIACSQVVLGLFFYFQHRGHAAVEYITWLPIVCLMLFMVSFQLGTCPISYNYPSEILDPTVKTLGNTLVMSLGLLGEFGIATLFPMLAEHIGFFVPFWIFGLVSFVAVFFVVFWLPETKGKSFLEIQNVLRNKL
ncbi:facilitated trehalose transporter Tret1-2 homolog [Anthonomus grandis grandis]|uniref:facilitated trehalose transporter Tret1-2 homolog n=1 Tax=Anthonomus grandis grandis TaxID=2921223 RepID=UPI0021665E93|nr:facilitated trehalose transporter Tret1-2 homolog [Anthonomus grandis grandis]